MSPKFVLSLMSVIFCVVFASASCLADNSYLNPARIYAGDVTELVLEYDNKIPSLYALDTTELERGFKLLETKSRIMRVNDDGEIYHRMQWRLKLQPYGSGALTVPSLEIGDRSSRALQLEVLPPSAEMRDSQRVFLEIETEPAEPYAGQQVLLRTRLLYNTAIANGSLAEPRAKAAAIFGSNDIRRFRINREGSEFEVIERVSALVPEAAGTLKLLPATWDGVLLSRNNSLHRSREIHRQSPLLELDVRDRPAAYRGSYWLPARALSLARDWQRSWRTLETGAAIDFTLRLSAVGLPAEALPDNLLELDSENIKIYPDRSLRRNEFDGSKLIGSLEQRYVVILPRAGEITIPGMELTWWDVENDREMAARLEPEVVEVVAASVTGTDGFAAAAERPVFLIGPAYLLAAALLAAAAVLLWSLSRFDLLRRGREFILRLRRKRELWAGIKRACSGDDAPAVRRLLLEWARLQWRDRGLCGLHRIDRRIGDLELAAELRRLDAALYSPSPGGWRGDGLWLALQACMRRGRARGRDLGESLPELYPG